MSRTVCIVEGCSRHPGDSLICRKCEAMAPAACRLAMDDHEGHMRAALMAKSLIEYFESVGRSPIDGLADLRREAALLDFVKWSWARTLSGIAVEIAERRDAAILERLRAKVEAASV